MDERNICDIDKLCDEITSHSYSEHRDDFNNDNLGTTLKIKNIKDFNSHVKETLTSKETLCFEVSSGPQKGTKFFYNENTNSMIIVPGLKKLEDGKELPPTIYRPKTGKKYFKDKLERVEKEQGFEPEIKHGIYELLPALEKSSRPLMVKERTPGQPSGPEQNLEAFVKTLPEKAERRHFRPEELRANPQARKEAYKQMMDDKQRISALDRIAKDIRAKRTLNANDIRSLSREDLEGIKQHGDKHLKEIVQQREKEREKDRGLER